MTQSSISCIAATIQNAMEFSHKKSQLCKFLKKISMIEETILNEHASKKVIIYALFGYFYQGLSRTKLATIYGKSPSTIGRWIADYYNGKIGRAKRSTQYRVFSVEKRRFIAEYFSANPTSYLAEAREAFYFDNLEHFT